MTPDLADTYVPEHCPPCVGNGMVLEPSTGQLRLCSVCRGEGRRLRHAYETGRGEQGSDSSHLAGPDTPGEELELGMVEQG